MGGRQEVVKEGSKVFFFEKKKQRTFDCLGTHQTIKSLFASFSSEKEESSFL
jgi:hypothetical protein